MWQYKYNEANPKAGEDENSTFSPAFDRENEKVDRKMNDSVFRVYAVKTNANKTKETEV